ncbi:hypothetical protein A8C46_06120 [Ligilactobacillus salivarius]|uniref:crAss001_48 related protein n=1 Tax=Ligilactobacillus salivarius TaxID=1624 RepID=UPI000A2D3503|nr:hypothetical protein [Ligilactobacillus salivarius]OTF89558.1 hypothetical protein A8C38_07065 [Ligilactobacillus salivarius]PAY40621.1 hypothetical protein A8C39_09770 [Ligilactobacillus salivarius]PAY47395.1 hypothetical protein A8C42_02395 [Ligilactobacillus salivarius]PAY57779.1 hypothetical protein A8C46_06120 [Ligilactobacillus salivarius]PAY62251.1 hypothetical protein A8C47_07090 [Ligilactobacillus salivarius]
MSDYKLRMKQEYLELTTRISKLCRMIVMVKADKLDFKLSCKLELLEEQLEEMEKYALVLEARAIIEEIELMKGGWGKSLIFVLNM